MELGTGLGLLSTFCAKKLGNEQVFTYEANPQLEPIIQQNYALNKVSPHLEICMLGSQPGQEDFYLSDNLWDSSNIQYCENLQPIQVTVKAFNDEIKRINPSFLIMDIEGGEYELCQYADFHNVKKLSMELHEDVIGKDKVEFVKSKLKATGFELNEQFSDQQRELFWERS
jgi:FkbM family methyltransferase